MKAANQIQGHIAWTLRNADGSVAASGEAENLFTRTGRRNLFPASVGVGNQPSLPEQVVIFDGEHPAGVVQGLRCVKVDTLTPAPNQTPGFTVASYTRTFTGSYAAPTPTARTIRGIGLAGNNSYSAYVNEGGAQGISAYLRFTTPITQTTLQTFEYVYRLTIVVDTKKSLRRYDSWTPLCEVDYASKLVSDTHGYQIGHTLMRCTWGSHYFVDGGLVHRGSPVVGQSGGTPWAQCPTNTAYPSRYAQRATRAFLTTDGSNVYHQGPVGMFATSRAYGGAQNSIQSGTSAPAWSFQALASHEGTLTSVFKHVVGETYAWNVVGSVAFSQGNVEVRGPYIPDEHKSPWHWLHWIVIDDAGDTDPGTEGTYHVRRMAWGGYPYPTLLGNMSTTWDACEMIAAYFADAPGDVGQYQQRHQIAFDGEFYWMATTSTDTFIRLSRWRAGSNEQMQINVVEDTTRWQPFTAPTTGSRSYGVASDGAGQTWLLAPHTTLASQKLYRIDNTKPGRHYQRPSGAVLTASPQTFTVSADDEIHVMFPFTAGDVGKKIRYVNSASNGADSTRTITAYNSPTSVDVDGAAFVNETGLLWHWVTVETKATNAWPAVCGSGLWYDAANARLWTISSSGLHYSTDGGVTWATIDELNGLSTTLAKAWRQQDGDTYSRTFLVGNGGKLYWIDTNNGVNKYTPGPSVHSGTHERIAIASLASPPGGYATGTLASLVYDGTAPDLTDADGALWIGQDRTAGRCFWRMACGPTFVGGGSASYGETSIGGTSGTYLHSSFQYGIAAPDGSVYLGSRAYNSQWKRAQFDEATGALAWVNAGDIWFGGEWFETHLSGDLHIRPNGIAFARSGLFADAISDSTKKRYGSMVGAPVTYRYDDVALIWRPFYGSAAQFNAKYGTTNGGKRKCHATWQKLLAGAQPNNIELRFVQAGGGTSPPDEYVAGESFTFGAAFGVSRTNTQDLTWVIDHSLAETEQLVEMEDRKVVSAPGNLKVYYWRVASSAGETAKPLGTSSYPTNVTEFNSGGNNYGWMPMRANRYYRVADAGVGYSGSLPDSTSATYGATSHSQHLIGLDLGASPPAISRLQTIVSSDTAYYLFHRYHRTSADRGRMRVYYSDDNAAWTEVPEVRFQLNGASAPDAGYANVYVEHYPEGGQDPSISGGPILVTFDLQGAGLGVGARTHRYWQIHIGNNGTTNATTPGFGGVWATDSAGNPIGLTANHRIDEAHDNDLGFCDITAIDWIQTRTGLSGQGTISTVDDGDADGRTNIVTIDSGTFNTGVISTVTDYLAWQESPGVGNGYVRRRYGVPGLPGPWTTGRQARSRIIAVTTSQITVADDIIPDSLSGADFEIRRPATGTSLAPGTMPWWDRQTGYMAFDPADLGREYRVTRKAVLRLP